MSNQSRLLIYLIYLIHFELILDPWSGDPWSIFPETDANCLRRKTPCWIHLMPRNVATITVRMVLISPSERWILCLFSLSLYGYSFLTNTWSKILCFLCIIYLLFTQLSCGLISTWSCWCLQQKLPWIASINVTYLRKLLSYLLLYMIISLEIAMMKHFQWIQSVTVDLDTTNLFILIALYAWYRVRDRELSRIPKKRITRILKKSRKVRRLLRTYIRKSIPKSTRMHLFTNKAREKIYAHGIRFENKGTTKYPSSAVRRKYPKSNKYRILKIQNQYSHVIKSPKPKQSNAWRSNSVPNVYKNLNHRVNHFKPNLFGDIETNPGPVINSTKIMQAPYS